MEKPIQVEKIINYLKELLAQKEQAISKYETPIMLKTMETSVQLQFDKNKIEAEISLLKDQITAIEKLI